MVYETPTLNNLLSRVDQYLIAFLLSLFIYPIFAFADQNADHAEANNIVGGWRSEPSLSQLGIIQGSYAFNADGSYAYKADFKSFCQIENCVYYWRVFDGKYSIEGETLTLYVDKERSVLLKQGQTKPDIRIESDRPFTEKHRVKIEEGNLIITNKNNNETEFYKPIVSSADD